MTTASITTRTRMMVQDTGRPFACNITVNGVQTVFDLPVESISSTATLPIVTLAGNVIPPSATPQYVFDYKHGVISFFPAPAPPGSVLGVQGVTYDYFDDDEVLQAVGDAFNLHVQDQDPLPVIDPIPGQPILPSDEEYLVSILAAIELLWMRATDSSQIVDVHTPEGVFIPASERYRQIVNQINALTDAYKQYSLALGVGLFRLQVLFQRRVSLTTNRLVPLFREQEYNQPYTGFQPTAAAVGSLVQIYGQYFTGTTTVTFGGVPSTSFSIISDTQINAYVPVGAITGQIGITTPGGTVLTTAQFVVGEPAPYVLYGPQQVEPPIPPGV